MTRTFPDLLRIGEGLDGVATHERLIQSRYR